MRDYFLYYQIRLGEAKRKTVGSGKKLGAATACVASECRQWPCEKGLGLFITNGRAQAISLRGRDIHRPQRRSLPESSGVPYFLPPERRCLRAAASRRFSST